jgi:hypothetical protein
MIVNLEQGFDFSVDKLMKEIKYNCNIFQVGLSTKLELL